MYFNPRPHEEGDYINRRCKAIHKNFNPRPHEEGDFETYKDLGLFDLISIHALMKRATANLYNDYLYFEAKYHISDIFHQ